MSPLTLNAFRVPHPTLASQADDMRVKGVHSGRAQSVTAVTQSGTLQPHCLCIASYKAVERKSNFFDLMEGVS